MKEYRLGDIITIKHGYAFDGEHIVQEDNGIVLVTPGNFRIGGGFQEEKCKFYSGEIPDGYVLSSGDFIVTMTDLSKTIDTLGYSALVPESDNRVYLHNQRIGLVSFKANDCFPGYIYFLMRTHPYQRFIANTSTGSTVHHTSPSKIYDYRFYAPSYEEQREIAERMFAYEKIIKNNQRQIKLLEETAQRLYKEWFVDLRFPGHENTKITDGVPEGWKIQTLSQISDVVMGQSPKSEFYNQNGQGLPFHQGVGSYGTRFVVDKIYSTSFTRIAEAGSILFSVRAPVGRLNLTRNRVVIGRGLAAINHRLGKQSYLFYLLKEHFFKDDVIGNGAIFASISKDELLAQQFTIPVSNLIEQFNVIVSDMDGRIAELAEQVTLLIEARDRLLPKLMSGEIEL